MCNNNNLKIKPIILRVIYDKFKKKKTTFYFLFFFISMYILKSFASNFIRFRGLPTRIIKFQTLKLDLNFRDINYITLPAKIN